MKKQFEPFKVRHIRLSEEVWKLFKERKKKSGETWNNFIKNENKNE